MADRPAYDDDDIERRRQMLYWRLLTDVFEQQDSAHNFDEVTEEVASELTLPKELLDPNVAVDTVTQRHPELRDDFEHLMPAAEGYDPEDDEEGAGPPAPGDSPYDDPHDPGTLRRALVLSKLLINVFGPNASRSVVNAQQYNQWTRDVGALERAFGFQPGQLRGQQRGMGGGGGQAGHGVGHGFDITDEQLTEGLRAMERDIIKRMAIREVLEDDKLAEKVTPSMPLLEQLLRDKSNLSGTALKNAKMLIRKYVDELAQVLLLEVEKAAVGKIDYSVPPKRVFRNLDLKRTIWNNLTNYDPEEHRLYVDKLYYRHTATKKSANRLIIVVDQSGSMVDSMVNCTILASIFAGLPNVEAHLIAYDTRYVDLTDWVHDPFEVLLRTNLGGGTEGMVCMECVRSKIVNPKSTALVWISDYYDWDNDALFSALKGIKESGVHLIPVGSVSSSGYLSINGWFKKRLKEIEAPLISGSVKTLIKEIKQFVAT
jgi:hypothetical protein